jgi:hypothetical protein
MTDGRIDRSRTLRKVIRERRAHHGPAAVSDISDHLVVDPVLFYASPDQWRQSRASYLSVEQVGCGLHKRHFAEAAAHPGGCCAEEGDAQMANDSPTNSAAEMLAIFILFLSGPPS